MQRDTHVTDTRDAGAVSRTLPPASLEPRGRREHKVFNGHCFHSVSPTVVICK